MPETPAKGTIRAGIGGWTFEPWRGVFYPDDLAQSKELQFASRALPLIEVNGTFYRTQTPATFAKWAKETPDGFVFSLKGPRYAVNRSVLAEAGDSIKRFLDSGITALGDRLGPLLWQLAPTKKFDPGDLAAFLALLPARYDGQPLRHALEVRHPSFVVPEFVRLLRDHSVAVVYADHAKYPAIPDVTADFVYARLQTGDDNIPTAYTSKDLEAWAKRATSWAAGGVPEDLARTDPATAAVKRGRDVYVLFIHEGKVRAPAAAQAFMKRVAS